MVIQQDQDNSRAVASAVVPSYSRAVASVERRRVERRGLLAGHRRSTCAVLAVAAWAATAAAVIGGGQLGRGAAIQITLAASMATAALGETLLSRLWQTVVSDPGRRQFFRTELTVRRCHRMTGQGLYTAQADGVLCDTQIAEELERSAFSVFEFERQ